MFDCLYLIANKRIHSIRHAFKMDSISSSCTIIGPNRTITKETKDRYTRGTVLLPSFYTNA